MDQERVQKYEARIATLTNERDQLKLDLDKANEEIKKLKAKKKKDD